MFFHWLTFIFTLSVLLIFSNIILLILPSSDLNGFIKRHGVADLKFCLWSFNVKNALFYAIHSIRSSKLMFFAISFPSRLIAFSSRGGTFLQVFVSLFLNIFCIPCVLVRTYLWKLFKEIDFEIEIETNLKTANFLDVTFNLTNSTYRP